MMMIISMKINRIISMKNGRKGQTQQVFIYIMVILIVGAVLLFGYKAIDKLFNQTCDVDKVSFQTDIKSMLNDYSSYGDEGSEELKAPCGYTLLCFADSGILPENVPQIEAVNQLMFYEVSSNTGNNVFLIKGKNEIISFQGMDNIVVPGNSTAPQFTCIDAKSNTFYLRLSGIGRGKVQITSGN
jgi:hypothetical protein